MMIQEPVQAAIWSCLNHYAYSDAIFLAERLYAEVSTDEALFLLATCYYRSGKPVRTYNLLQQRGCPTAQCRYLQAQCCLEINKLAEAESILAGNLLTKNKSQEDIINEFGDSASYALRLLGQLYRRTERSGKAADHYRKSLKLNPFIWSSFESLCQLGENPDASKIFQVPASQNISHLCQTTCQTPHTHHTPTPTPPTTTTTTPTPTTTPTTNTTVGSTSTPATTTTNISSHITTTTSTTTEVTPTTQTLPRNPDNLSTSISSQSSHQIILSTSDSMSMNVDMTPDSVRAPITSKSRVRNRSRPGQSLLGGPANMSPLTPSFGVLMLEATPSPGTYITPSPVQALYDSLQNDITRGPKTGRFRQSGPLPKPPVFSQSGNTNTRDLQSSSPQAGLQSSNNVQVVRRSSRLFSNASSSVKENNKSQSQKKFTIPKAPAKKSKTRTSKTQQELNELNKSEMMADVVKPATVTNTQAQVLSMQKQSVEGLMNLLQGLGKAYCYLAQFECARALDLFSELPPQHYNTGWVMCQVGRAHFEMADYQKAERAFSSVRSLEPHHLEGLEIYSTTLWHLQREVHLSTLAQELSDLDKHSPEAWCATGNCFSLQKEHDVAIKFFQRAVQVDPNFAYAYTLLGHEYVLTEELDKAMSCFRNAIRVDSRHYNAWYGIGMIYYKQEKFALARVHFGKALTINRRSSVLLCHIAVVEHAMKKSDVALEILNKAMEVDPKNPLCKFHRASILFATDRHKEALAELEELKQIVPKESLVYFLIGKVHKKLGQTHLALMNFSWAMDLDPKGANNQIKEAIDKRYVTDEDDPTTGEEEDNGIEVEDLESSNNSPMLEAPMMQLHPHGVESDESL